jgi:simple sugar transport system permease protein
MLGALDAGAARMQFESGVAADIIQVIQALVLAFVAAPTIIRALFRARQAGDKVELTTLGAGWRGG